jgi:nucleoside-diphosphate-sugar epimerase
VDLLEHYFNRWSRVIGSNLVEDLLASGEEVIVLDDMVIGSMLNSKDLNGRLRVIKASWYQMEDGDENNTDPAQILSLYWRG